MQKIFMQLLWGLDGAVLSNFFLHPSTETRNLFLLCTSVCLLIYFISEFEKFKKH